MLVEVASPALIAFETRPLLPRASVRQLPQIPIQFPVRCSAAIYPWPDAHGMREPLETAEASRATTRALRNIQSAETRREHDAIPRAPSSQAPAAEDGCPRRPSTPVRPDDRTGLP